MTDRSHTQTEALARLGENNPDDVHDPLNKYEGDDQLRSPLHECASRDWPLVLQILLVQAKRFHQRPLSEVALR